MLSAIALIIFVAPNAATFYAPIAEVARRLSSVGKGNPSEGLVAINQATAHVADLIDGANDVFRNIHRREYQAEDKEQVDLDDHLRHSVL